MLLIAGDHVPLTPFNELVGKLIVPPEHIGEIWVKFGEIIGLMVIVKLVEFAH